MFDSTFQFVCTICIAFYRRMNIIAYCLSHDVYWELFCGKRLCYNSGPLHTQNQHIKFYIPLWITHFAGLKTILVQERFPRNKPFQPHWVGGHCRLKSGFWREPYHTDEDHTKLCHALPSAGLHLNFTGGFGQYKARVCISAVSWHCCKPFSQWQHSFHMKAVLPLA